MTRNLATQLGVEVAVVESSWPDLPADLQASKIDLCYLTPTAQRGMFVDFADPLFYDTYAIVARKGFSPKSWAELDVAGSLGAADIGSAREETARRFAGNAAITGVKTRDQAMQAVPCGPAGCVVSTVFPPQTPLQTD